MLLWSKISSRKRIFEFSVGLNTEFDQIRVQVLGKESLLFLNKTFSIVQAKKGSRIVMLDSQTLEDSIMISTESTDDGLKENMHRKIGKNGRFEYIYPWQSIHEGIWCTYCFKFHGKCHVLNKNRGFKRDQDHFTNGEDSSQTRTKTNNNKIAEFNKEDNDKLRNLLNSL